METGVSYNKQRLSSCTLLLRHGHVCQLSYARDSGPITSINRSCSDWRPPTPELARSRICTPAVNVISLQLRWRDGKEPGRRCMHTTVHRH